VHGPGGRGVVKQSRGPRFVETPYLQLVLQRLWEQEQSEGSRVLRLQTLERLGGAGRIVQDHLELALAELTPAEKATAAGIFNHLVTPSGTKIAHALPDLADYAGVPERAVAPVVSRLVARRILRPVSADGGDAAAYEIFHDVLADAVLAWRTRYERERALEVERARNRRRHRRLVLLAAGALAALAATVAVTIFALSQRSDARAQRAEAQRQAALAEQQRGEARKEAAFARTQELVAQKQAARARRAERQAAAQKRAAESQAALAKEQEAEAQAQRRNAEEQAAIAEQQRQEAQQ